MSSDGRNHLDLADEIVRYLDSHPNAADSVEGIVRWWLARQRFTESAVLAQRALDRLVAEKRVTKITTADGRVVYRRASNGSVAPDPNAHDRD